MALDRKVIRRESFFPILLALLWGLNWPAIKIALGEIPPFVLRS
jgi:drug/metabolite transporter (DMT)-like permease